MKGTANWRAAWRGVQTRKCIALIKLTALDGSVLRLSTTPYEADDVYWDGRVVSGSIASSGSFLGADVSLARASFDVVDGVASATGGLLLSAYLAAHDFVGGPVMIALTDLSLSATDALNRFGGNLQTYKVNRSTISFTCLQSRDWNRDVRPRVVTRAEFPGAQEEAIGAGLSIVIGAVTGPPFRFATPFPVGHFYRDKFAGGQRVAPAVLVDVGRGGGGPNPPAKVVVAGHKCTQVGAAGPVYGTSFFIEGSDGLLHVMDPAAIDTFNADTGAGFNIPDTAGTAWQPVMPQNVEIAADTADNPRAILDRRNETTFARLSWTLGKTRLAGLFASSSPPGTMKNVFAFVIYRSAGLSGGQMWVQKGATTAIVNLPNSTLETAVLLDLGGGSGWGSGSLPNLPWDWSQIRQVVTFNPGTPGTNAGTIDVIGMGISAEYTPTQDLLKVEKVIEQFFRVYPPRERRDEGPHNVYSTREVLTNVSELRGKFFANVRGHPDDASGTYTTVANALIEKVPDVVRFLLERFGGVPQANINLSAGVLGSFADARAVMKTWRLSDMVVGIGIQEAVDLHTVLSWVMSVCAVEVYQSEFDGRWHIVPWRVGPSATYTIPVRAEDLMEPDRVISIETTPDSDVSSGIRIPYGWNAQSKSFMHEVALTASRSSAGFQYRNIRDANMLVVVSTNDKLDFGVAGIFLGAPAATFNITLAAGLSTVPDVVTAIRSGMNAADPARKYGAGCGALIITGVNDTLEFVGSGGTNKTATIFATDYGSMSALATAATVALQGQEAGWSVSYNRTTRKFSVSAPGGSSAVRTTGPLAGQSAWPVLGFQNGYTPTAPQANLPISGTRVADYEREEDLFFIACHTTSMDLLWRNGTNGFLGTRRTCAELLGYDWTNDDTGGKSSHVAICPKRERESRVALTDGKFGRKRELNIDGRALYDTDTALECRNRLQALLGTVRGKVEFTTEIHADVERGDVITFDSDVDAVQPYAVQGTDGSWAGKLFRVLETHQSFGASWHTNLVLMDLTT